jgi:hypothetical protein
MPRSAKSRTSLDSGRHVFATGLQGLGVLDHLCVEMVEVSVGDGIFDDDESAFVETSYRFLQIA